MHLLFLFIPSIICIIDILVNMNTAFYEKVLKITTPSPTPTPYPSPTPSPSNLI